MCQSGKNQAQLGSRTVELVGEEEEGGVCGRKAGRGGDSEQEVALKSREDQLTRFTASLGHCFSLL